MMNKEVGGMVFGIILTILLSFGGVNADAATSPSFDVVLTNQNPYPAEPGENFNIEIEIQNSGDVANNKVVEIVAEDPFGLLPGELETKLFSIIPSGGSVTADYNMFVNNTAITGDYEIEFRIYTSGQTDNYIKDTITLNVQGIADLMVTSIQTEPENIEPGGLMTIIFNIRNIGTGTARQVKAKLNSSSDFVVPVLSGGLVYVGDIEPNATDQAELEMSIDSTADYKTYITTLTLFYKDENNTAMEETVDIGIPVTGSINLEIIQIETDFDRNKLKIQVANKGSTDAVSVEAKLVINNQTIGIDYVSQLKSSKYTIFDFPLVLQGTGHIELEYIGPALETIITQEEVILNYPDPRITQMIINIIALAIALYIIRYLWIRFFKKGKKK
jgi:hypothetical protein